MLDAKEILELAVDKTAWSAESKIAILCEYIDNQKDNNSFEEFVKRKVEEDSNW